MALEYKSGKCQKCGYKRCKAALEFRHRHSRYKEITLANRGITYAWSRVKRELDKCDLLCANCHREIHEANRNHPARKSARRHGPR